MKRILGALLATALLVASSAFAQPTSATQSITPLTRDLGALKTLTAQGAATVDAVEAAVARRGPPAPQLRRAKRAR